jgi:hypothetical protein
MWQQTQRDDQQPTDDPQPTGEWILGEPPAERPPKARDRKAQQSRAVDWKALPPLPKWPPLPEEDRFSPGQPEDTTLAQPSAAPGWNPDRWERADLPTRRLGDFRQRVLGRLWPTSRRRRIELLAGIGGALVLLLTLVVAVSIGNALSHRTPLTGTPTSGTGAIGQNSSSTATASSSPTALNKASPTAAPTAVPVTITFTCASGSIGGEAKVCIQTAPNADVTLSVRYCDGSYAKGKTFHGGATASSSGDFTWRWNVTTSCAGNTTATVTAKSAGQTVTQTATFTLTNQSN